MQNIFKEEFKKILISAIKRQYGEIDIPELDYTIEIVFNKDWDISSSISLRLSKTLKKSPNIIAEEILKKIETSKFFSEFSVLNGYINVKLDVKELSSYVINDVIIKKEKYGSSNFGKGKTIILEYPSVNPNKPWHIGHLRNPLLGDSMSKILKFCSYEIKRLDYIEDLGLQMAEILWGKKNLKWNPENQKYDQFLGEKYVEINNKIKENENIKDEINLILKKMEDVSSNEAKEIREIATESVKAQYETSFKYNLYHDLLIWESDILNEKLLEKSLELLKKNSLIYVEKEGKLIGCTVLKTSFNERLEDENKKVLLRSNGVPTYLGKDIALHMWKLGIIKIHFKCKKFIKQPDNSILLTTYKNGERLDFEGADIAINIIGSAQNEPQTILKNTLLIINSEKAKNLIHISYGELSLKEGKISGRSGTWLGNNRNYTADDLIKFTSERAKEILLSNNKISKSIDPEEVSNKIAISAIKFDLLKIDPVTKIIFDWDRALDFNSNSGPYCMYMYARICRILEKAKISDLKVSEKDINFAERDYGFELLKLISLCKMYVEKAAKENKPNVIAEYLIDISSLFGKFYENQQVLKAGEAINLRLAIVMSVKQTLYNMFMLLGIEPLSSM
ncbi:MAG: arginine--tRNA ligase [Candidatus Micrarchaeaceae archaeon]